MDRSIAGVFTPILHHSITPVAMPEKLVSIENDHLTKDH
jgi:hypothetical protein